MKIAVYSNKPHHQAVENIETIFGKIILTASEASRQERPKKPAPDGALIVCRELGMRPGDCLYLGDTNTDMKTGIAAGMDTVRGNLGLQGQRRAGGAVTPIYSGLSIPGGIDYRKS